MSAARKIFSGRVLASLATIGAVAALAVGFIGTSGCQKLKARDNLRKGVLSFKAAQYPQAADFFRTAVDLDPNFPTARLYLATAYMSQYIPGANSEDNDRNAKAAMKEFQTVLSNNPDKLSSELATASIASLYYNEKKWDEAEEWNKKLIAIKPESKEAYYTLGVIAWTKWIVPDREARNKMGMGPDDPGPLKDKKVREELKAKWKPILDAGIEDEKKALQIDPNYDQAMAYMNLLIRYRADLDDTPEEYKKDAEEANNWVQKSLETQKSNADRKAAAAAGAVKQ